MSGPELSWSGPKVKSWAQFVRIVKRADRPLLSHLGDFSNPILVAGCQRSGTTAVTRLITKADGMADYRFGADDELDAALILSGQVSLPVDGRVCFQTTYLNDRVDEYFEHGHFKLVWILREPLSVVYSMLHHWRRSALNRLYDACGRRAPQRLNGTDVAAAQPAGWFGPSRLEKACASYIAKVSQTFDLADRLHPERMIVLDYDDLVQHKHALVERVFDFVGLPYSERLTDTLHSRSLQKGKRFAPERAAYIRKRCLPVYESARSWRVQP